MTDTTQGQDSQASGTTSAAAPDVDSLFPKQDVDDLFPRDYKPPAAPADRNVSPIHDFIYSRPHAAEGRVLDAFGYGFAQNWGATQQQMTDADEYMRKAGIWDDYSKGQHSIIKAANEAVMRPAVSAFLAAKGAVFGLLPAGQAAVEQIGKEVGLPGLGHEVAALPEAFPAGIHQFAGIPHVPEAPRPPVVAPVERVLNAEVARQQQGLVQHTLDKIAEAKDLGVIGAGEDGYFGTKPAVEAVLGPEATAVKQAGVTAKEWNETLLGQKPEGAVPSPVVQAAPIAAPSISSDQLRSGRAKGESDYHLSPAAVEEPQPYHAFTEMARDLPEDVNNRFQVHGLLAGNPDKNLVDLLNKGIDPDREFHSGAPRGGEYGIDSTRTYGAPYLLISDDGKDLRETGAKNVVAVGPAEANLPALKSAFPNVNFMTVPEAENFMKTGEKPAAIATGSSPPPALPPIIPQAIVDQEKAKLIAAGRPPEEAEAWAKVVAAHYQARAERFEGAKGSAEDLYAKEAPKVKSRGKSVEMAQSDEIHQSGGAMPSVAPEGLPSNANTLNSKSMKLRTTYWGGESGRQYSHTPVLFKEVPYNQGQTFKFGIAEDGTPTIEGSFLPQDKHLGRAIQEYLSPLEENEYIRTAWKPDDYNHLKNGTHLGSMNHATGTAEAGLSVAKHLEFPQKFAYKVTGTKIGTGSDAESILETSSAKPAGPLLPFAKMAKQFDAAQKEKISSLGLSPEQAKALQTITVAMAPKKYAEYLANGDHEIISGPNLVQRKAHDKSVEMAQTETPEFKNWFGESKVVDESGAPRVLYHGTRAGDIDELKPSIGGEFGPGIYLSDNPGTADFYASNVARGEEGPSILPVYAALKNPFEVTKTDWIKMTQRSTPRTVQARLMKQGYDGIIGTGINGIDKQYIAFDPKQIKSAIGNRGTFDPNSPKILYQFGGKLMRTADPEQYTLAETMEKEGSNPTEIYYQTGLFRGADRIWRQEIDDSQAMLKIHPSELKSSQSVSENGNVIFGKSTWLDDVIDHPALFKAYPDLRNIRVEPLSEEMASQGIRGQQDGLIIRMNKDLPPEQFRSTLLHETQHIIQDMEGFAPGDNKLNHLPAALGPARREFETVRQDSESEIKKVLDLDDNGLGFLKLVVRKEEGDLPENFAIRQADIDSFATPIFEAHPEIKTRLANIVRSEKMLHEADDIAYTKYTRAMGEVEARNVQKRDEKGLGTFTPPWTTEDVPRWLQHNPASRGAASSELKRGKILLREGAKSIITLFSRTVNASTIIHETGHQWLEELMRDARDTRAPQSLKDDASTILKWFKVDRAEDIETEHHELFARGFERYMMEGKAPTPQLASVFEKFKAWLSQIYQSVLQLKAPINDQVRGVFDRLITVRPEEEARAPSFADIHEADAEHTPPAQSREGAQTVASERDRIAATHIPEENNERLEGVGNRAGRLPAGGEQPGDHGNAAGTVPEEEGATAPTGEVGAGGTETAQEGTGARKAAERVNKAPTPLLRFIAERGGISARDDLISDLRQSIGGQNRFVPGLGQLIREPAALSTAARRAGQSGAMTLDRAREAAIEAGMLPEGSSIRDLLDRMDQELRGHAPPEARPHNDPAEMAHAEHNFVEGINDAVKEAGGAELSDAERTRAIELWRHEGLTDPAEIIERLALETDDTEVGKGAPERAEPIPGWDIPSQERIPHEAIGSQGEGNRAAPGQPAEPGGPIARLGGEAEAAKPNPVDPNAQLPRPETKLLDKAGNIRIENLNTPEDVSDVIRQTARDNGGFQEVRGPISDAQVLDLADAAGVDAAYLDTRKLGEAWTAPQIVALRNLMVQTATAVRDAAIKAAEGSEAEIMAYAEAVQRHRMVQERVHSVTAEAGRALRAFQSKFTEGMAEAKDVSAIVQDVTGKTLFQLQEEAKLMAARPTASMISKAVHEQNQTRWQKTRSGLLSWFINDLISGPITHAGYSVGNTVTQLFKATVDTSVAAAIDAIRGAPAAERVYFGEVGAQLYAMVRGMRDGYSPAVTALQTGVPYMKGDVGGLIGQIEAAHRPQAIPGKIGYVIETPSRAVTAIHTIHYSMNYEAEIARRAYRSAMVDSLEPGTAEFNTKIADFTQRPPPADMQAAHDEAMKMVLMKSTKFGTGQYHLQKWVNSNILAKIVMPFMQVGTNILHESFIERTPLGLASQTVRDNLMGKNGPMARSTQAARLGVGIGVSTAVIGLTAEGILTGGGPSDHRQMAIKEMTGWRPYSIKVGESYVPYRKYLGGLGPLIAGTADIYEVGHTLSEEGLTKAAAGSIFGFAEVIADESWMKGLSNFIDAARHWDRDGERYLRNLAADFIPFSIGLQQVTTLADPYHREVRSMLDAARAHIPGMSQGLFPVRDIWGEPIESHTALGPSQANNDPATQALLDAEWYPARIGRKVRGVELTGQQYDDLARISGRMARMRVSAYVNTPGFAMIPKEMRAKTLRDIIDSSRESARGMIMMQNQQIWQQAAQNKIAKLHPAQVQP